MLRFVGLGPQEETAVLKLRAPRPNSATAFVIGVPWKQKLAPKVMVLPIGRGAGIGVSSVQAQSTVLLTAPSPDVVPIKFAIGIRSYLAGCLPKVRGFLKPRKLTLGRRFKGL